MADDRELKRNTESRFKKYNPGAVEHKWEKRDDPAEDATAIILTETIFVIIQPIIFTVLIPF